MKSSADDGCAEKGEGHSVNGTQGGLWVQMFHKQNKMHCSQNIVRIFSPLTYNLAT